MVMSVNEPDVDARRPNRGAGRVNSAAGSRVDASPNFSCDFEPVFDGKGGSDEPKEPKLEVKRDPFLVKSCPLRNDAYSSVCVLGSFGS